ncbi:MAG: prepilin peptidase [Spirochaetota bacterium]
MVEVFIILVGLCMASFLGSLSYRIPRGISMISPPSSCPSCGKRIMPYDLVPVLSYTILGGRCRYCKRPIGVKYLIIEVLTPVLFIVIYRIYGINWRFLIYAYLISILIYLSLIDLDTGSISFIDVFVLYAGAFVKLFLSARDEGKGVFLDALYGFGFSAGLLLLSVLVVYLIKKKQPLGSGDMMIIPGIMLYFSLRDVSRILIFTSIAGLISGLFLVLSGKIKWDYRFPMLPFVAAGVFVEFFISLV